MRRVFPVVACLSLALTACAGTPPLTAGAGLVVTDAAALPPPSDFDPARGLSAYAVGPSDTLRISVFGLPESGGEFLVDSAGRIDVPLAGAIDAAGKTPSQIADEIEANLRAGYLRDPQVTVNVTESVNQLLTIDGQVGQPGRYPVTSRMTLIDAVAVARGTTEFAKLDDVVIFRTVGEQRMAALYNLGAIRRGIYADPSVYAQDVIVVGDSPARRRFRDILQAAPLLTTPIIAFLQTNNN